MPRVKCASVDCKWNNDNNMCIYGRTGHTMLISDCYVSTVHDGRQHFHRCKAYEKSEVAQQLESEFAKFLKDRENQ